MPPPPAEAASEATPYRPRLPLTHVCPKRAFLLKGGEGGKRESRLSEKKQWRHSERVPPENRLVGQGRTYTENSSVAKCQPEPMPTHSGQTATAGRQGSRHRRETHIREATNGSPQ